MRSVTTDLTASSTAADFAQLPGRRPLSLERRLPLLIFGILAVVLATSLGLSYYEVRLSAEISSADRLSSLSVELAAMIQQQWTGRVNAMHRVASDPAVIDAVLSPEHAPSAAAVLAMRPIHTAADTQTPPQLLTRDGRPIGSIALESPTDVRQVQDEIQALSSATDSVRIGRLFASKGHASVWLTVPVRRNGEVVGFLAQERRLSGRGRALKTLRDLVGPNIDFYVHNVGDPRWVDLDGALLPAPSDGSKFRDSVMIFAHAAHGAVMASTVRIQGTQVLITLQSDMSTVVARPLATMRALAGIAMLLAVGGAAIAWLIGRQLTRPLVELTGAAEAMAQGDYSERVADGRRDEIGRLATAFNRMAERVQVSSHASTEAVDRLTKSASRQQFLAEASQVLAGSLSDQTLLSGLARLCVPTLADYCTIHIADDDGTIRRVETVYYDPSKEETVRALVGRYENRVDDSGTVSAVMRTRQPLLIPHLDLAAVRAAAKDETTARLVDEVRPTSFLCVPLVGRGRAFGAMSFTMTDSGRELRQDDVELAMELARRTAVAIDNAVIYRSSLALRLEAEAASNAKSDFLAKMSHEIRTPINAMMGYAELLEMGISGPVNEGQAKQLGRIRASGEHLTSLVDEILDLAKIESGRMDVVPAVAVAGESAEGAVALIRPTAATKGVELSSTIGGDPGAEYIGDRQRVQQILTNLLSNAVKFTPTGGSVSIRCRTGSRTGSPMPEAPWTSISVVDTGVGIAPEDLDRIFHPFVQVENGYTRAHGGTGLGLTISRTLAQMMGGEIEVESVPGRGSQFTLWLPAPASVAMFAK